MNNYIRQIKSLSLLTLMLLGICSSSQIKYRASTPQAAQTSSHITPIKDSLNQNQFYLDFGLDYNLAKHSTYHSIDSAAFAKIIDPTGHSLGYKDNSQYLSCHLGALYFYQLHKNFKLGTGLNYSYRKLGASSVKDSLEKYNRFLEVESRPLERQTIYHSINIPIYLAVEVSKFELNIGLSGCVYRYKKQRWTYTNKAKYETEQASFFPNFFDWKDFTDEHSAHFGLAYKFKIKQQNLQIYSKLELWQTYIIQLGLRYRIS